MKISRGSSGFILFVIQRPPFLAPFILAMPHWLGRLRGYMATLGAQIEKIVANPTILENEEHVTISHHLP